MIGMTLLKKQSNGVKLLKGVDANYEKEEGVPNGRKQFRYSYIKRSSRVYESEYGDNIQTCTHRENSGIQSRQQMALQEDIY